MRLPAGPVVLGALCLLGVAAVAAVAMRPDAYVAEELHVYPEHAAARAPDGRVDATEGAAVTLRATPGQTATAGATIRLDTLTGRRIGIEAELRAADSSGRAVGKAATVWARIDRGDTMLLVQEDAVPVAATSWTRHAIRLPVPARATTVTIGVTTPEGAALRARAVRVVPLAPIDTAAPIAPEAGLELDSAVTIVRAHALRRDSVAWDRVLPEVRRLAAGATTAEAVAPAIRVLLAELGDRHSIMQSAERAAAYQAGSGLQPVPAVRAHADGIGYVHVPAHMSASRDAMRAYSIALHRGLAAVAPAAHCGWIVDLRDNTGGNMWPMLAGVQPLLGADTVGMFLHIDAATGRLARSDPPHTALAAAADIGVAPPPGLASLADAPVTVLTGPRTASSGEAIAIAFRGRARTRSFGTPTAGRSTGNAGFTLPSGAAIALTTSVMADRTGRPYGGPVTPDEAQPSGAHPDATTRAAERWLRAQPGCR